MNHWKSSDDLIFVLAKWKNAINGALGLRKQNVCQNKLPLSRNKIMHQT